MRVKEGARKRAGAPLPLRPGYMYYIKPVDIVFLDLISRAVKSKGTLLDIPTECPSACSHSFIPTRLGTPFTVISPLGVAYSRSEECFARTCGRAFLLCEFRTFNAFWELVRWPLYVEHGEQLLRRYASFCSIYPNRAYVKALYKLTN